MKVFAYSCRRFDEETYFKRYAEEFGFELGFTEEAPSVSNCGLAAGSDFVSVLTTPVTAEILDGLHEVGVRMVCTRTIGYNHIDLAHAKEIGMVVTHVSYSIDGVAEYTVMMMLAAVRNLRRIQAKNEANDFRLEGLMGRQLKDMSVGIVGAGAAGKAVLRDLSGFGCTLYYCNRSPSPDADRLAERLSLDELLERCDVVSLHLEHNEQTHHIIDEEALSRMKDGSFLINTARGPLVDTRALIGHLRSGHLAGAALDVIEDELLYYYNDCRGVDLSGHLMSELRALPNVILTHHMAFYYDRAIADMVYNSFLGMKAFGEGAPIPGRLV
jgi:D-lactate dehydrogenase